MTEEEKLQAEHAAVELQEAICPNGLENIGWYISWTVGDSKVVLDGEYTAETLEAIAWWMKHTRRAV